MFHDAAAPRRRPSAIAQAARIGGVYAVAGAVWIAYSDRFVAAAFPPESHTLVQTYKGWAFVAATAALIIAMSSRALARHLRAVDALARSEARLRRYLEHAPMAVFVLDAAGRCLDANARATELCGCSLDRLRTLSVSDVVPPGPDVEIARAALEVLAQEHRVAGEYRLRRADGSIIWISAKTVHLEDGQVLAFVDDISERKAAEARLRQAAAVFDSTVEGVVITDADARIVAVNRAFTAITGYTEAEVLGADPRILRSGVQDRGWYREMWRALTEAGRWQGEIWNRRKNGDVYPEWLTISVVRSEEGHPINYVGVFTDLSRVKRFETALDHLAHTDALTGLPNRLLLQSRLTHALERVQAGGRVAVVCLNLDRFKQVNDSHGFDAGDELLKVAANRLRRHLRPADTLARIGADEFIAVIEDLPSVDAVADVARTAVRAFDEALALPTGETVHVGISAGISLFPDDGVSGSQLLQQAAAAMSYAKEMGGRGLRFHTAAMVDAAQARFALEAALREAQERRQFVLHYQPRISLVTGQIEGVEALIRWQRPGGRLAGPQEFVPVAEATGLIGPIGDWVLLESCLQMRRWLDAGCPFSTMAVNVSASQFRDPTFVDRVQAVLSETGLPATHLELEVTESDIMDTGEDAVARLADLGSIGVRLAIDDFGAGHSSLTNLRRLPIHTLKIDKSFLGTVPGDRVSTGVVLMIATLGAHLNLQVVAEGVETEAQRILLQNSGCHLAQGYLFSPPVPAGEIPVP